MMKRKGLLRFFAYILCVVLMLNTNLQTLCADEVVRTNVQVNIDANEGTLNVTGSDGTFNERIHTLYVTDGTTLTGAGYTFSDPVYWESTRGFAGWAIST